MVITLTQNLVLHMDKAEDEIDRALANSSDTSSSWESSSEESDYIVEDSRITEDDGQSEPPRTLHEVTEIQIPFFNIQIKSKSNN